MSRTQSFRCCLSIFASTLFDSGCGHHLIGDESKFSKFWNYNGNDAIITADNSVHPVEKEGIVTIQGDGDDDITLDSIFQVVGMKKNLFSVSNAVGSGALCLIWA